MQLGTAGQVELKLKASSRDETTNHAMSPLEFMQRLAERVPRPRLHLVRSYGVLAPNAKLRPLVVPQGLGAEEQVADSAMATECEAQTVQDRPHRISWARLLKRVLDIDMQHCQNCGPGELQIIAAILERPVIKKILTHLGLDPQPPPKGRAGEAGQYFAGRSAPAVPDIRRINTGCAALRQPGWRRVVRGLAAGRLMVNPDTTRPNEPKATVGAGRIRTNQRRKRLFHAIWAGTARPPRATSADSGFREAV